MNKPRLEDKNGIANVIDKEGNVIKSFSTKDHGKSYLSAAQLYLQQNYDKLMAEDVEQMDEAKGEYGPDSSLHGHPLRDIDAHLKDNGYIHSKKSDTEHHYTRKDGRMIVHVDPKTKKVVKAFLEPIKKLKEEVEQMDEETLNEISDKTAKKVADERAENVKVKAKQADERFHVNPSGYRRTTPGLPEAKWREAQQKQMQNQRLMDARKERLARTRKEKVEYMNEISGATLGSYIVNARKSEKEKQEKGKQFVQQLKDAGHDGFGLPLDLKKGSHRGKLSRQELIKLATNKLTNPDFPVSNRVKVPATESVEKLEESEGHSIVKKLKIDRKHEEAGKMAFKHGLSRSYGPHFGMRSTKDKDERDFHRGYDIANMESKKKRAGADRAFVAESRSESAVEGFKNGIIRRLHNLTHPESGKPYMIHVLVKHGFDKVKDAVNSAAREHGDGAEEIGSSDITAATNTALNHLGEKRLEERSLTPAEKDKKEEIIMAMKEKGEPKYGAATAIAKRVAENRMLSNILTKLQEQNEEKKRGRPSKEEEQIGIHAQLKKHQDQGDLGSGMIKFDDGSSHKISPEHREKALRVLGSLIGPGKSPDRRDQVTQEMGRSLDHFKKHIGVK